MKLLTPAFPGAMRALNELEPLHQRLPSKVRHTAMVLEACMQAYGRALLATDRSTPTPGEGRTQAVQEAENHMVWRYRLRRCLEAMVVDGDANVEAAVAKCEREIDHLMYTIDLVFAARNVHCTAVASGVHS